MPAWLIESDELIFSRKKCENCSTKTIVFLFCITNQMMKTAKAMEVGVYMLHLNNFRCSSSSCIWHHCSGILRLCLTWVQLGLFLSFLCSCVLIQPLKSQLFLKYSTEPSNIILTSSCSNIVDVSSYDELKAAITLGKWARGPWSARYYFVTLLLVVDKEALRMSIIILGDLHARLISGCNCWL